MTRTFQEHAVSPAAVRKLLAKKQAVRLDLGCGGNKTDPGFIGMDKRALPGVDIVHDLERFPWPLPDDCATAIVISHFWEHLKPWLTLDFMAEVHRVARDGANVFLAGPYGVGFRYVQDPTHCNPVNDATFLYWDNRHMLHQVYTPPVLHVQSFERVPAGGDTDFNAVLQVCKAVVCPHKDGGR